MDPVAARGGFGGRFPAPRSIRTTERPETQRLSKHGLGVLRNPMTSILTDLRRALIALVALTVLVGVAYPVLVWGIGQVAFRGAAGGSLVERNGAPVGSALIGQRFDDPKYFWGRPSAAGEGYDPTASGASNLGP